MIELFNPADYQDDEDAKFDNQEIDNICYGGGVHHLLICGWSEKPIDWHSIQDYFKSKKGKFSLHSPKVDDIKNKGSFHCLDLSLDYEDVYSVINNLEIIIKGCLTCFNNYINVALAYKYEIVENNKKSNKLSFYYQTRVTRRKIQQQIAFLKHQIGKFRFLKIVGVIPSEPFSEYIVNRYLFPGIEVVGGNGINGAIVNYLNSWVKKTYSFFSIPYEAYSITRHTYHHPSHSFPLPILLISSHDMPDYFKLWKEINWEDNNYKDYLNELKTYIVLGYYTRRSEYGCEGPHIVLCPENIESVAEKLAIDAKLVYLIVLIHELAHAMMDKNRANGSIKSLFAHAMEESLANMITLKWFEDNNKKELKRVKRFIKSQPQIYQFGIKQFDAGVDWNKWRDSYRNMDNLLRIWFEKCMGKQRIWKTTVMDSYNQIFEWDLEKLLDFFRKSMSKLKSIDSYCRYVETIDNNFFDHKTSDELAALILFTPDGDPLNIITEEVNTRIYHTSLSLKTKGDYSSGFKKFAQCILGFYYANIWIQSDDRLFCSLVARNALFASRDVVEDVKAGILGTDGNKESKGNDYASWDHMLHARRTKIKKGVNDGDIVADDNTIANQAIKLAIIESYKRHHFECILDDISLLKDYEACHVWDLPGDERYYASIANMILLPRALAKLTDHNDAVKELLKYEVFIRFGFKPDEEGVPAEPKDYNKYIWRDQGIFD